MPAPAAHPRPYAFHPSNSLLYFRCEDIAALRGAVDHLDMMRMVLDNKMKEILASAPYMYWLHYSTSEAEQVSANPSSCLFSQA